MSNTYKLLKFDALPAATISELEDEITITAPPILGVKAGQTVVFFLLSSEGYGIAVDLMLTDDNLKLSMELILKKRDLPRAKILIIDYGAYVVEHEVHRSAPAYYPPLEEPAKA